MSVRVVVLAMLSGLLALTAVAPAQASFPGHNGRIAYAPPIFGLDTHAFGTVDLSNRWVSISTGAVDLPSNIAWSANGKRFAFDAPATSSGAKRAIYIGNADGSGIRQVGAGNRLRYNPAWSPDGTKLAFVQDNGSAGSGDIYTMTTTGTSLTRLTTSTAWEGQPDWAPDGTRIAYTCVSGGRRQLCQMTPKGGSKTVTTGSLGLPAVIALSWSPTSLSLVFSPRIAAVCNGSTGCLAAAAHLACWSCRTASGARRGRRTARVSPSSEMPTTGPWRSCMSVLLTEAIYATSAAVRTTCVSTRAVGNRCHSPRRETARSIA